MQTELTQDAMDDAEQACDDLRLMRQRMVLDLQWFLSQRLDRKPHDQMEPPRHGGDGGRDTSPAAALIMSGRLIEEKPW